MSVNKLMHNLNNASEEVMYAMLAQSMAIHKNTNTYSHGCFIKTYIIKILVETTL